MEENGSCSACFLRKRGAAGTVKPSQSSLRDASSPERGSFICADRQTAKSSPREERLPPERGKMSRSDKRGNLAKPTGFD